MIKYGSRYYVNELAEDERQHIIANINLDCICEEGANQRYSRNCQRRKK